MTMQCVDSDSRTAKGLQIVRTSECAACGHDSIHNLLATSVITHNLSHHDDTQTSPATICNTAIERELCVPQAGMLRTSSAGRATSGKPSRRTATHL